MHIGRTAAIAALIISLPLLALAQHDHMKSADAPKKAPEKTPAKTTLKPAEGANIKILAPKQDQVLKGDSVPLQFKLTKGKRGHHAHAYVDGQLMGMFESEKGTLNGSNRASTPWSCASSPKITRPSWTPRTRSLLRPSRKSA
jgi:hypothetical protein